MFMGGDSVRCVASRRGLLSASLTPSGVVDCSVGNWFFSIQERAMKLWVAPQSTRTAARYPTTKHCTVNNVCLTWTPFLEGPVNVESTWGNLREVTSAWLSALVSTIRCTPRSTGGRRLGTSEQFVDSSWKNDQNVHTDSSFLVVETAFVDVADDDLDDESHARRFAMLPEWADLGSAIHHLHLVAPAEHAKGILPSWPTKSLTFRFRLTQRPHEHLARPLADYLAGLAWRADVNHSSTLQQKP